MNRIFISYRRSDAQGHAGRLYDHLKQWFDDDTLFYDQESIDSGESFPTRIESAISEARVVLVVIGPNWLSSLNRRATQTSVDYVRQEVELALTLHAANTGLLVLPILMGDVSMPTLDDFIPPLRAPLGPLCALDAHAFQGKQSDWDNQFLRLRNCISRIPGIPAPRFRLPTGSNQPFHVICHALSPHFQDPNNLLANLRDTLKKSGRVAAYGMGGIGKTHLALKYSHEYRDHYTGVWYRGREGY